MSVSFQAAVNAYKNVSQASGNLSDNNDISKTVMLQALPFSNIVKSSVANTINTLQNAEATSASALVKKADITDVVTAMSNAEITLKTVVAVRDKLLAAYQEIQRMPI